MRKKFFSLLVLLAAVATGAMAQTETLLTTITATAKEQANYSTANVATVSFSYTAGGSSAYHALWGWWGYGWSATVNAAEGYTITKCVFYDDANRTVTDSEAPFVVETTEADKTPRVNGTPILEDTSKGIKKIDVYGYATPTTYTLLLVADPEKGSVAVTNLLGSDIIDNGNGNYTVPENAEVTILATPLEGFEFTGWIEGNVLCDFIDCGTALNTLDNPMTITMTADVAYKAEFEEAVERELAKIGVNFPTADCPADDKIQMAGTFAEGTMTMEKIVATGWFVSYGFVNAAADDTFKFRDATNNDKVLCKYIPANGDAEGKWVQAIFKFGNYWQADNWKGTPCKLIEEDLSDANQYAWKVGMPEPDPEESAIENISGSTKAVKRIVNGQLVIEHNGKFYNALGAEVK